MYVKVTGTPTVIHDAGAEVNTGVHVIHDGREELGDVDWVKELDLDLVTLQVLITTGPAGHSHVDNKPWWTFTYAWWYKPGPGEGMGMHGVVTDRNIYILGDNGKTIDRA